MSDYQPHWTRRFERFLMFNCRTVGTNQHFIGPEWARLAFNEILIAHGQMPYERG